MKLYHGVHGEGTEVTEICIRISVPSVKPPCSPWLFQKGHFLTGYSIAMDFRVLDSINSLETPYCIRGQYV